MGPVKAFRRFLRNRSSFHFENPSLKKNPLIDDFSYFTEWFQILRQQKPPLDLSLPWIPLPAVKFLRETVKPGMRIFEWGCGGSTLFYESRGCEVTAIEHSLPWSQMVSKRLSHLGCKVVYIPPDDNRAIDQSTGCLQSAASYMSKNIEFKGKTFIQYSSAIDESPDDFYDLIAIDGRARSSCLLHSLRKVKQGGYILLDNSEREEYQEAMNMIPKNWSELHFVGPIVSGQTFGRSTVFRKCNRIYKASA